MNPLDKLRTAYPDHADTILNDMLYSLSREVPEPPVRAPLIDALYNLYGRGQLGKFDPDFATGYRNLTRLETSLAQQSALCNFWLTKNGTPPTLGAFLESVRSGPGCLMFEWTGMSVGVEPDGHTHT